MNRRLHILGITWMALLGLLLTFEVSAMACFLVGGICFTGMLMLRHWRPPLWVYSVAAAVCFSALSLLIYDLVAVEPAVAWNGITATVRGTIIDRVAYGNSARLDLWLNPETAPHGLAGVKIRLNAPIGVDVNIGDVVEYTGKLSVQERDQAGLYAQGYRFTASAYAPIRVVGAERRLLRVVFAQYRAGLRDNLARLLPRGEGDLLAAMLTGESGFIAPEIRRDYARAGASHLLVVSGLHLAALSGMLEVLLAGLLVSRRRRAIVQMISTLLFMALTGFSPSVLRAGIMLLLNRIALLLGRDADTLNSLGAALVLILLFNPYGVLDVGLQLSYLATMGIAAFTEPMTNALSRLFLRCTMFEAYEMRPKTLALISAACVSPAATVLTLPLIGWCFGQISLVQIVVNLIAVPITSVCIPAGMLCSLLGFFPKMVALEQLTGLVAGVSVSWLNRCIRFFAGWRYATVSVKEDYLLFWLTAVVLLFLVLWYCRVSWRTILWCAQISICSLLIAAFSYQYFWQDVMYLSAVHNGTATAIAYRGQAAVIGMPANSYELQNILRFLNDSKITSISILVIGTKDGQNQLLMRQLRDEFEVEQTVVIDQMEGFDATLFNGRAKIWTEERRTGTVWIEAGGMLMAKSSDMKPQKADILINQRNEVILSSRLKQAPRERYYNASVVALATDLRREGSKNG